MATFSMSHINEFCSLRSFSFSFIFSSFSHTIFEHFLTVWHVTDAVLTSSGSERRRHAVLVVGISFRENSLK
jgi:hypothetical protein